MTTPSQLRGSDYQTYFTDYLNTFGSDYRCRSSS